MCVIDGSVDAMIQRFYFIADLYVLPYYENSTHVKVGELPEQ